MAATPTRARPIAAGALQHISGATAARSTWPSPALPLPCRFKGKQASCAARGNLATGLPLQLLCCRSPSHHSMYPLASLKTRPLDRGRRPAEAPPAVRVLWQHVQLTVHLCMEVQSADAHLLVCGRHAECEVQEDLNRGHDHSRVAVAEAVIQHIHDIVHLLLPCGAVVANKLQHLALCPLRKVLHSRGQAWMQAAGGMLVQPFPAYTGKGKRSPVQGKAVHMPSCWHSDLAGG